MLTTIVPVVNGSEDVVQKPGRLNRKGTRLLKGASKRIECDPSRDFQID